MLILGLCIIHQTIKNALNAMGGKEERSYEGREGEDEEREGGREGGRARGLTKGGRERGGKDGVEEGTNGRRERGKRHIKVSKTHHFIVIYLAAFI